MSGSAFFAGEGSQMNSTTSAGRWEQLGPLLMQRRVTLSPQWHNRGAFSKATGVDYRLVYDIEEARRTNFGGATLAAIEAAYRLAPGTIGRFLDGGELEMLPSASASSLPRIGPPGPADDFPQEALRAFGPAAEPIRREIAGRAETAAAAHGIDVTAPGAALQGAWVFPRDPVLAAQWDRLTSSGISLRGIVQIMAIWREDEARNNPGRGEGAAGLIPRSALPRDTTER